mmetsp:Transcript_24520/g.45699  ORF Transcript_24520/g.45699 Transcript_24520/m.45699 type:complete len:244 (-) Transcript_24520:279-1010(-)
MLILHSLRVQHFLFRSATQLDGSNECIKVNFRIRKLPFRGWREDVSYRVHLVHGQLTLVNQVQFTQVDTPLSQAMHWLCVRQPLVRPMHLGRLSKQIVQDVHLQLQLRVDVIPVVHHLVVISAQPDHHPHRQVVQGLHRLHYVTIAGLAVSGNHHHRLVTVCTQLGLNFADFLNNFADVTTQWRPSSRTAVHNLLHFRIGHSPVRSTHHHWRRAVEQTELCHGATDFGQPRVKAHAVHELLPS